MFSFQSWYSVTCFLVNSFIEPAGDISSATCSNRELFENISKHLLLELEISIIKLTKNNKAKLSFRCQTIGSIDKGIGL